MVLKKWLALWVLLAACLTGCGETQTYAESVLEVLNDSGWGTEPTTANCGEFAAMGVPLGADATLCRSSFLLGYDTSRRTALWVAEHLTQTRMIVQAVPRTNEYGPDPDLPASQQATLADYVGSGYERGHLAAALNSKWSLTGMAQSFYLTNIVPQNAAMNGGVWANLEALVRGWAIARGDVYVYTGPVYGAAPPVIGQSPLSVPNHLFKIIYDAKSSEALAFLVPNETAAAGRHPATYLVSVRAVEQATGLSFLTALPAGQRAAVLDSVPLAVW